MACSSRSVEHPEKPMPTLMFCQVLGLSIDEAIAFWRKSFSRMDDDKFNKEHKYNIRHSFGLEGKRANYPAKR